jgi:hypothetical protein
LELDGWVCGGVCDVGGDVVGSTELDATGSVVDSGADDVVVTELRMSFEPHDAAKPTSATKAVVTKTFRCLITPNRSPVGVRVIHGLLNFSVP